MAWIRYQRLSPCTIRDQAGIVQLESRSWRVSNWCHIGWRSLWHNRCPRYSITTVALECVWHRGLLCPAKTLRFAQPVPVKNPARSCNSLILRSEVRSSEASSALLLGSVVSGSTAADGSAQHAPIDYAAPYLARNSPTSVSRSIGNSAIRIMPRAEPRYPAMASSVCRLP